MGKVVGAHLSIKDGIYKIQGRMESIGGKCCAIFLKNQKRFESSPLSEESIKLFREKVLCPELILPHGSYLINLGNPNTLEKSFNCLIDDLDRCEKLGIKFYNLHPGSDVSKMGREKCLGQIADNLNKAMDKIPSVIILLENMAGQGKVLCGKFEDIKFIIDRIKNKDRIGVCLDTCHMFGFGYDIRTEEKFGKVMAEFDEIIGLKYLKAMHLNDSQKELGSKKDRHESIGKGLIGIEAFRFIMNSPYFDNMPLVLETPNEELYKEEIELLYSLVEKK